MSIRTKIETITPKKAAAWLKTVKSNRRPSRSHINFLAREIAEGRWKVNGEAFLFNGKELMDGQHRCHAIIKADQSVRSLVVYGTDETAFNTIDTGMRRSAANVFDIRGEEHVNALAAALRLLKAYDEGTPYKHIIRSPGELESFLETHPNIRASVEATYRIPPWLKRRDVSVAHYLLTCTEAEEAETFISKLITGHEIEQGSPLHTLRERLIADLRQDRRSFIGRQLVLIILAWNAQRKGAKKVSFRIERKGKRLTVPTPE